MTNHAFFIGHDLSTTTYIVLRGGARDKQS